MPDSIQKGTTYHGIEMDGITADIAKELFPDYNIEQNDFAKTKIEENSYDFAIGNPPFANIAITSDRKYANQKFLLHDYFFAKSLDALKPGGILMFVTSAGTMNKQNMKAREYMAERADLIGAIRLPGGERGAFSQSSNTQVTTDIIILRKRKRGEKPSGTKWVNTASKEFTDWQNDKRVTLEVNEYFVENTEMILGSDGPHDTLIPGRYGVINPPAMFTSALKGRIETFPANIFNPSKTTPKKKTSDVIDEKPPEHKEGSFYLKGSDIYQYLNGEGHRAKLSAANKNKMKLLIEIKNSLRDVFAADIVSDDSAGDVARVKLNSAYDQFVKKYGHLNKSVISYSKATDVQIEKARASLRLITLENDEQWNEGTFIPTAEFFELSFTKQSEARARYRAAVIRRGDEYSEGSFDPASVPKNVHDNYPNLKAFSNDPEYYRLASIEKVVKHDDAPDSIEKGKVFFENIFRLKSETKIENIQDAVSSVIAENGIFDLDKVTALYGKSRDETIAELGDRIFQLTAEPFDTWAERSDYLSGDVKTKLEQAKDAAQNYPQFQRNVDELEKVIPEDLVPSEIEVKVGAQWLDNSVHEAFLDHLGIRNANVSRPGHKRELMLEGGYLTPEATSNWGQFRVRPQTLFMAVLNAKPSPKAPQLTDSFDKKYPDVERNNAIQAQYKLVKAEWNMWWEEQEIYRQEAAVTYNEKFRRTVPRKFDGSNLNPPGMLKDFNLRDYQKSIITRIIQSTRNTYMSHAVGAGKTASMIISAMELKRLGQVKLPMITVPKSVLRQFSVEFLKLYPDANVKIMQADDTKADSRKHVIADVTLNEYDAVVISHETFNRINLPAEFQEKMIMEEIAGLRAMFRDAEARHTKSQIELQIQAMVQKLEKLTDSEGKDDVFDFSEIGVDYLIVDEAHNYRKIGIKTTMSVKGVDTGSSQRGINLYWISKWLRENYGSKTMTLASGTPILNTQGEVYSIQRLLQEPTLLEQGIDSFTSWANLYAEVVSRFEMDAGGNFKYVDRLSKFVNLGDLRNTLDEVFDTVTSQELNKLIVMPTLAGKDGREMMLTPMSDLQKTYQDVLKARIKLMGTDVSVEAKRDFILPIMGDGRKASIDMRLIDSDFPNDPESKLNLMIDQIYKTWEETSNQPFHRVNDDETGYDKKPFTHGPATQLVFVSLGLSGPFKVQNWIRARLVKMGMPNNEIAYIKDYDSATKRAQLFQEVRAGRVRVVMGHPQTLGTGVNVQDRVAQIHNLDPLWLVGEDEQRVGRALRFGNMNPEISVQDWSMNGGFDSPMWGLMKTKSSFITDFFKSDLNEVEALQGEDYYQILEAASSGDPRYKELADFKRKQNDLKQKKKIYEKTVATTTSEIAYLKESIQKGNETVVPRRNIAKLIEDIKGDKFKFTFAPEGKTPKVITDRRKANQAISSTANQLEKEVSRSTRPNIFSKLGTLAGLDLWINVKPSASMLGEARYAYKVVPPGAPADDTNQYRFEVVTSKQQLESIVSTIRNIEKNIAHFTERVERQSTELAVLEKKQKTLSFDENADIKELNEKTIELERELASEQTESGVQPEEVAIYKNHPHFVQILKDRVERGEFSIGPKLNGKGLSAEMVNQAVEKITSNWDGRFPQVKVVQTVSDLPESIIELAGEQSDNIRAVLWHQGQDNLDVLSKDTSPEVYIVADKMANNRDIKAALAHEIIGHLGMLDILGPDFAPLLTQVWTEQDKPMYREYRDTVSRRYPDADPDTFAMEMIALMAEKRANNPIMSRIILAVRRFLRKIGLDITYSYDVVMDYLSKVERRVFKGKEETPDQGDTGYKSAYEVDDGPSFGDASQRAQLGLRETLFSINEKTKPMKPPLLELTRPVESFFRLLSVPLGGRDVNGNLKLSKPMQDAAHKLLHEMKPNEDGIFGWLNPIIETSRHGWLNRYGTPEGFEATERRRHTDEFMILQELVGFINRLKDLDVNSSQARALNDLLVKGKTLDDDALNDLGSEIRSAIDKLGKQMVEAGILHEGTYQKNLGQYLHRSYAKYEFDKKPLMRWVQSRAKTKRASIIGDELKLQGRSHNFGSVGRLLQDIPDDMKKNAKWIKKWIIYDRVSDAGRVSKRMYYPENWKMGGDALGKSWVNRGTWEIRKNPRGQPFLWRQWTDEESEAMGLIEDARYNIIKSYQLMAHDLSSAKFFNDVAENPAWFSETLPEGTVLGSVDPRHFKPGNYSKYDWIKVPNITIPKTSVKKWGALSGGYLRAPIWRDINELEKMQQPGWWGWMMRLFKESKTVLSPNVHFNNVMGNVVLSELHDFTWTDIKDGFIEYARKGDIYKQAFSKGVFNSGYVEAELSRIPELEQIIREIEKEHGATAPDVYKIASFFSKIRLVMRNSYRAEDEVFRMMSYMHDIGRGMDENEAAKNAVDRFLNYDIRAPWPNALRRSVLPFFSYTYAFVPVWLRAMSNKPWKIAKIFTFGYVIQALSREMLGDDEDERRVMSDRDKGYTWSGLPKMLRLPISQDGDPIYIGMQRLLPGGGIMETDNNILGMPEWFAIGGPIQIAGEVLYNRSQFTGQDIVNDMVDTGTEKSLKRMGYLWRATMPNIGFIPGTWNYENLTRAFGDDVDLFGRQYSPTTAMIRQFGPKLYPFDKDAQMVSRMFEINKEIQALKTELSQKARLHSRNRISDSQWSSDQAKFQKKIGRLTERVQEFSGSN